MKYIDIKEMQELAKAAAHSAVVARYSERSALNIKYPVDEFLEAYEYAFKKIAEKQRQSQNEVNMEFGSNEAKFR